MCAKCSGRPEEVGLELEVELEVELATTTWLGRTQDLGKSSQCL